MRESIGHGLGRIEAAEGRGKGETKIGCDIFNPVALRQAQSLPSRRRGANGLGEGSWALPCHLEIIAARPYLEPVAPRIAYQRPAVGLSGTWPAGLDPVARRRTAFCVGAGG